MSTSTPAIGLPWPSLYQASANSTGPGVGERTIVPPFSVFGECIRQNGPSWLASVSVWPLIAVIEQADERRKAQRASHQHGFVVGLVGVFAERDDVGHRGVKLLFGQFHFAGKVVKVAHERRHHFTQPRVWRALQPRSILLW